TRVARRAIAASSPATSSATRSSPANAGSAASAATPLKILRASVATHRHTAPGERRRGEVALRPGERVERRARLRSPVGDARRRAAAIDRQQRLFADGERDAVAAEHFEPDAHAFVVVL